jgi:hypothetical protein
MVDSFRGSARQPGPVGMTPPFGRPSGNPLWQRQTNAPLQATARAAHKTHMPLPLDDSHSKNVHAFTTSLWNARGSAAYTDIVQSSDLSNCPIASILSALAFTASGQGYLAKLVRETTAATETDFPGLKSADLVDAPSGMKVASNRYFTVGLPRGAIEVSDVLYTNDADRDWSAIYMHDPSEKSLWGAVIEKALALQIGSYRDFDVDAVKLTANDFWEKILGAKAGGIPITDATGFDVIKERALASTKVTSIAASKEDHGAVSYVTEYHGHAMLGMQGNQIRLYDPAAAKVILLTPAQFRHDFQAILFQK